MAVNKIVITSLCSILCLAAFSFAMEFPTESSATKNEGLQSSSVQELAQRFYKNNECLVELFKSVIAGIIKKPMTCFHQIEAVLNPEIVNDTNKLMSILVNPDQLTSLAKGTTTTPEAVKACIANKVSAKIIGMHYKTLNYQHFQEHIRTLDNDQLYLLLHLMLLHATFYDLTNNINACTQVIGTVESIFEGPMPDMLSIIEYDEEIEQQAAQERVEYSKMVIHSIEGIGAFLQMQSILNSKRSFEDKVAALHPYLINECKEIADSALVLLRQVYSNKRIELIQKLDLTVMRLTYFAYNMQRQIQQSVKRFEQLSATAEEGLQSNIADMFVALETVEQKQLLTAANLEFFGRLLHVMLVEQNTIFYTPLPAFIQHSVAIVKTYLTRDTPEEFEKPFYQVKRRQEKLFEQIGIDAATDTFMLQYHYSIDFYTKCYQFMYQTLKERQEKTKRQSRLEFIKKYFKVDTTILPESEGALPDQLIHKHHEILIPKILEALYRKQDAQPAPAEQSAQLLSACTKNPEQQISLSKKKHHKKGKKGKTQQRAKKEVQQKAPTQQVDVQPAPEDHSHKDANNRKQTIAPTVNNHEFIHQALLKNKKTKKQTVSISLNHDVAPTLAIHHDPRVLRWFKKKFREQHAEQNNRYHSFALCADQFLVSEGILKGWKNNTTGNTDRLFEMPGKMVSDLGKSLYCIFHCCLDRQNCCYHRGITYLPGQELADKFGLWNIDIKQEDHHTEGQFQFDREQRTKYMNRGQVIANKPYFVSIRDHLNKLDLTIFRPCKS